MAADSVDIKTRLPMPALWLTIMLLFYDRLERVAAFAPSMLDFEFIIAASPIGSSESSTQRT
jgi:hypothetical protein